MRSLFLAAALFAAPALSAAQPEHVILCGGPALRQWEDFRVKNEQHDRWWANFIRASTLRMAEIRRAYGKEAKLTWIVYRPGYVTRGREDGKPYTTWIRENATKRNCELIWVDTGAEAIQAINSRPAGSILTFDFFGHSNRHCFLLDYGNEIMAASKAWIHEDDLGKIRRKSFDKRALCQSYGCHTGESMSAKWRLALGIKLVGAHGKTDYAVVGQGRLPTVSGRWVR
ncbi:MAG: hypothetical protein HKO57_16375 [Akkermansiaceae bacterium]|nr:hypothetical protein [Akkermansiaceae bacterium]